VEVFEMRDGSGFLTASVGLGRFRRPGIAADASAHVELVAATKEQQPVWTSIVAALGGELHAPSRAGEAHAAGDTVAFAVPEIHAEGFVLADKGALFLEQGSRIRLLEVTPDTRRSS
jgi:hypothetical protein